MAQSSLLAQPLPLAFREALPSFRAANYALRWPPLAAEDDRGWTLTFIVAGDGQLSVFDSPSVRACGCVVGS